VLPIQLTVSVFLVYHYNIDGLFWTDGRRPVYLYSLPVFLVGSIGVALATDIPNLLFWRFLQVLGASTWSCGGCGCHWRYIQTRRAETRNERVLSSKLSV